MSSRAFGVSIRHRRVGSMVFGEPDSPFPSALICSLFGSKTLLIARGRSREKGTPVPVVFAILLC